MKYFLNGIEGSTTWVAVDAYDESGKSVWATLSNAAKSHKITLDYKKTGTHEHASSKGASIKDYFYYDFYYQKILTDEIDIRLTSNGYSSADTSIPANYQITMSMSNVTPNRNSSTDTLFMGTSAGQVYYKMAKVPGS